jgi:hypothetical protein
LSSLSHDYSPSSLSSNLLNNNTGGGGGASMLMYPNQYTNSSYMQNYSFPPPLPPPPSYHPRPEYLMNNNPISMNNGNNSHNSQNNNNNNNNNNNTPTSYDNNYYTVDPIHRLHHFPQNLLDNGHNSSAFPWNQSASDQNISQNNNNPNRNLLMNELSHHSDPNIRINNSNINNNNNTMLPCSASNYSQHSGNNNHLSHSSNMNNNMNNNNNNNHHSHHHNDHNSRTDTNNNNNNNNNSSSAGNINRAWSISNFLSSADSMENMAQFLSQLQQSNNSMDNINAAYPMNSNDNQPQMNLQQNQQQVPFQLNKVKKEDGNGMKDELLNDGFVGYPLEESLISPSSAGNNNNNISINSKPGGIKVSPVASIIDHGMSLRKNDLTQNLVSSGSIGSNGFILNNNSNYGSNQNTTNLNELFQPKNNNNPAANFNSVGSSNNSNNKFTIVSSAKIMSAKVMLYFICISFFPILTNTSILVFFLCLFRILQSTVNSLYQRLPVFLPLILLLRISR